MRSVRALDRSDLWFGIILAALFILVVAVFGPVFVETGSRANFWINMGFVVVISLARGPISRLGRAARFFALFCLGFLAMALFMVIEGRAFDLALAAGLGLVLSIVDIVAEYFHAKKEAEAG
jgi:hypothetical protein